MTDSNEPKPYRFVVYATDPNGERVMSPRLPNREAAEAVADAYAGVLGLTHVEIREGDE